MFVEAETKVIKAEREALMSFSCRSLREYAYQLGIELGRNKEDVVNNLLESGRATLCASLGD
jgi:hypothetical protein